MPPSQSAPSSFENVTLVCKANVYFDGKVVSHTITLAGGTKKSVGLIYPGAFHFGTGVKERMDITVGSCRVRIDGESEYRTIEAGTGFDIAANSGFDIEVSAGVVEYVCSFD